jgi:hypothetical protein
MTFMGLSRGVTINLSHITRFIDKRGIIVLTFSDGMSMDIDNERDQKILRDLINKHALV